MSDPSRSRRDRDRDWWPRPPAGRRRSGGPAPALLLVVVGVLYAGCSPSRSTSSPTTSVTSSTVPVTTVTTPAPTTSTPTTSTTLYRPVAPQPTEDQAGGHLLAAWRTGNRAAALQDATPAAVNALFAQPFPVGGIQARGCQTAVAGPSTCDYRVADNLLTLQVVAVPGGWLVEGATFES